MGLIRESIGIQKPLLVEQTKEKEVSFRKLVKGIPSTTYATFALYRYPAKFIPQVIAYVLSEYARPGMTIFDPFAGYGTVGVVSKIYGYDYELWDLNPLLEVLHAVAVMEPKDVNVNNLLLELSTCRDEFVPKWSNLSYWFPEEFLPFLFRVWGFYHSLQDEQVKRLLLIPLLKATRYFSYDDERVHKLYRSHRSKQKIEGLQTQNWQNLFFDMVAEQTREILKKLSEYRNMRPKPVNAIVKGGVDTLCLNLDKERDILITSPPYLEAQEYIRTAKMDLFWLGYTEENIRQLSKKEIPYREVPPCPIYSETYSRWRERITEAHLRRLFEQYFYGVLGALTRLQKKIDSYLFLFVGPATLRGQPVPIDHIFIEHFSALGWAHELTLIDTIIGRVMFSAKANPATGLNDKRMKTEHLVVLRRHHACSEPTS